MRRLRNLLRLFRPENAQEVHFHRGPQGQPVPCYDRHCEMPHLSVDAP